MATNALTSIVSRATPRRPWWTPALLGSAIVLAAALRWREALRAPLWFDEIFTVWIARRGLAGTLEVLRHDMHPPLFFAALVAWRSIVGEHVAALRLQPMVFGVATVAATYLLARDGFGRAAGVVAALFVALHRDLVYESQELRSFAWLWCFQVVAAWAALRWTASTADDVALDSAAAPWAPRREGAAALYVAAGAMALYTHYLAGVVLAVIAAWGAWRLRTRPRRLAGWVGLHALIGLAFAPQVPTFLAQLAVNRVSHWVPRPAPADLVDLLRHASFGSTGLAVAFAALAALAFRLRPARPAASLVAVIVVAPVLATYVLTQRGAHLFTVRYMLYVVPFVLALVAGGVFALPGRVVARLAAVALVAFAARSLALTPPRAEPAELAQMRERFEALLGPNDPLFCVDTHSLLFFEQYAPERRPLLVATGPLPYYEGAEIIPPSAIVSPATFDSLRTRHPRWWAVRVHHAGMDGAATAARLDSLTGRALVHDDLVTVWSGREP